LCQPVPTWSEHMPIRGAGRADQSAAVSGGPSRAAARSHDLSDIGGFFGRRLRTRDRCSTSTGRAWHRDLYGAWHRDLYGAWHPVSGGECLGTHPKSRWGRLLSPADAARWLSGPCRPLGSGYRHRPASPCPRGERELVAGSARSAASWRPWNGSGCDRRRASSRRLRRLWTRRPASLAEESQPKPSREAKL
jgi:hypothetical protein